MRKRTPSHGRRCLRMAVVLCACLPAGAADVRPPKLLLHSGMCDASAGVALDANRFLAANDEANVLYVYPAGRAGPALQVISWDAQLGIDPRTDSHPEADIEAAARVGERIYWISSHGRNRVGKWRPNRHRFFATTLRLPDGAVALKPFGKPYAGLARDLARDERMRAIGLAAALGPIGRKDKALAPKRGGLNIEALCATGDGKRLLIGLRSPLAEGKAVVVPLRNPVAVVRDGAACRFGDPILLRLRVDAAGKARDLGVRSLAYSPKHQAYLILAGPPAEGRAFGLFRWSGKPGDEPMLLPAGTGAIDRLDRFTPEAMLVYPHTDKVQLLSDDGSLMVKVRDPSECKKGEFRSGFCQAKYLNAAARKTFRSTWVDVK